MAEQIQHLYKHKATGRETSLPKGSLRGALLEQYDDLGESIIVVDPNTGINSTKLKKEPKAAQPEEKAEEAQPEAADKTKKK